MDAKRLHSEYQEMKRLWPQFELRQSVSSLMWIGSIACTVGVVSVVVKLPDNFPQDQPLVHFLNRPEIRIPKNRDGSIKLGINWNSNTTTSMVVEESARILMSLPGKDRQNNIVHVFVRCTVQEDDFWLVCQNDSKGLTKIMDIERNPGVIDKSNRGSQRVKNINWSGYRGCPYCGSTLIVKCGGCNQLNCQGGVIQRSEGRWFECACCTERGYIRGSFDTVQGHRTKKK